MSQEQLDALLASGTVNKSYLYKEQDSASLRFGALNLICITSDRMFEIWAEGTAHLMTKSPVTREQAIAHFAEKGVTPNFNSTGGDDVPLDITERPPSAPAGCEDGTNSIPF